jgi:hypothetical protein
MAHHHAGGDIHNEASADDSAGSEGLFLVVLILASCSGPSDDGAGGGCGSSEASITCLNVTRIVPTYLDTETTEVDLNPPCPTAPSGCPPLTAFSASQSIFIPAGQTVTVTLSLVALSTKNEYVQAGGELRTTSAPSYSATYTFTAQTVGLNDTCTVQGSSQFTIADFNHCP